MLEISRHPKVISVFSQLKNLSVLQLSFSTGNES